MSGGSVPGNAGHGVAVWDGRREERDGDSESGLSSPWQTSLTVNHMQPVCAHRPPTQQAGCAAYTEVHCGSRSCSNKKGWGVSEWPACTAVSVEEFQRSWSSFVHEGEI